MEPFVALGARSMSVLKGAHAAAVRGGAGSVSTLHVLAQIARFRKLTPPWPLDGSRGRLLAMTTDPRRTPSGLPVGELVAPVPDDEADASLREVEWSVRRLAGRLGLVRKAEAEANRPQWTNAARATVAGALVSARESGMPFAGPTHLLLGVIRLPGCAATEYLFVHDGGRAAAAVRLGEEPGLRRSDQPYPDLEPVTLPLAPERRGSLAGRLTGRAFARASRLARLSPQANEVESEAKRQAVRLGHGVVGPAHAMLAMLAIDAQLAAERFEVPARHAIRNRGAAILSAHGVDAVRLRRVAARRGTPEEPPAEALTKRLESMRPGDPLYGAEVEAALRRALDVSLAHRHPDTGTSHQLFALVEDDAGEGAALLRDLGVDVTALRERLERDLRAAPTWSD